MQKTYKWGIIRSSFLETRLPLMLHLVSACRNMTFSRIPKQLQYLFGTIFVALPPQLVFFQW